MTVVDASIAAKWFLDERDSQAARACLDAASGLATALALKFDQPLLTSDERQASIAARAGCAVQRIQ